MDDNNYIDDEMIDEYIDTFPTVWKGEKTYQIHNRISRLIDIDLAKRSIWNSKPFDIVIGFFTWRKFLWDMRHLTNASVWSILRGGVS